MGKWIGKMSETYFLFSPNTRRDGLRNGRNVLLEPKIGRQFRHIFNGTEDVLEKYVELILLNKKTRHIRRVFVLWSQGGCEILHLTC